MWTRLMFLVVGLFSGYVLGAAIHKDRAVELRPTLIERSSPAIQPSMTADSYGSSNSTEYGSANCLEGQDAIKKIEADAREYDSYSVFQGKLFLPLGTQQNSTELGQDQSYGYDNACALLPVGAALPTKIKVVDGKPVAVN